ncbi:DUF3806 domain-containing protein [Actinokineospora sp. NBRC 105648]|uniref:DUF3806 domain-containing protein n=1 Tax=Actinokineospora sp. NBRC 105648 TaxID=3032206 RepID=UPI0024A3E640|nr:DUF3806 domain-containing protein [Actinokineospora sp. NBRC 105648]GLZ41766.1 hypothetical protein Acsp05_53900 [Actinokineospora sp. NBRC 105648]
MSATLVALGDLGVDVADVEQLGALYDSQLGEWGVGGEHFGLDPNPTINLIGIGLGEHLVRRCGLRWVVATDEQGAEIAVHGAPGDVLIYPTNVVAKRWVARERGFLPGFADQIAQRVEEIRRAGS